MSVRRGPALVRGLFAAAAVLALGACVGAARDEVDGPSQLGDGETVVVGRVELVPPLRKEEQRLKGIGSSGRYENKIYLLADRQYRVLTKEPGRADFAGRIEATFGKSFFVRSGAGPFFILGGVLYLDIGGSELNKAYFPGGLKVSIQPGDKAVYVGTLQYHRNEFFQVTKVVVVDDYEQASTEFRKKFGTKVPLRKALLTRAK
jgi:hypothetical protein